MVIIVKEKKVEILKIKVKILVEKFLNGQEVK